MLKIDENYFGSFLHPTHINKIRSSYPNYSFTTLENFSLFTKTVFPGLKILTEKPLLLKCSIVCSPPIN